MVPGMRVCYRFGEELAQCISGIPISRRDVADAVFWTETRNGQYSVKSGYRLQRLIADGSPGGSAEASCRSDSRIWRFLWSLALPAKVQNFMRRCLLNTLPLKAQLGKRFLIMDNSCPLCHCGIEDQQHLFFQCEFSKAFWFGSVLSIRSSLFPFSTIIEWFDQICSSKDVELGTLVSWCLWRIWYCRNTENFEQKNPDPITESSALQKIASEYAAASMRPSQIREMALVRLF